MANAELLAQWFPDAPAKAPGLRGQSVFYRNLEEQLDTRRAEQAVFYMRTSEPAPGSIDFSTLDFLGLTHSGLIRQPFLDELAAHPKFRLGAGGSRLLNGNNAYIEEAEAIIADFHEADTALLFHSGFEANVAIMLSIPRPGDAIVYDELVHASMHEGMQGSMAPCKMSFRHNDVDSFRETLVQVRESQPRIKEGKNSVLVVLESMYSMDGDVAPLKELLQVADELFPEGNAQFLVDEAHTTGVYGRQGRGFVDYIGVAHKVAIRMHTYGKAMACTGEWMGWWVGAEGFLFWNNTDGDATAAVVCKAPVRDTLINFARGFMYSTAPSFPMVAAIRAGYKLLMTNQTQHLQDQIQNLVRHFFRALEMNPVWEEASDEGMLKIPNMEDWESKTHVTHVVPIMTRQRYTVYLCWHLQLSGINCFPIDYPVVPRGMNRLRVVFHAHNTEAEVEKLASCLCEWATEMMEIEESRDKGRLPGAARQVIDVKAAKR
ncbi:putative 8-amino-7-oxononanoate synthase [Beauveria bassiana]|uniref:Putative 8-amino-7-oxononanoate synthase n=1 Tax=Beauveria bassiana TaxID=176275 RepID=A0A2N6NX47_BEABA|nr:putative 8-amino-7-oxononanoate synthase [Beauveria bassiana]